MSDQSNSSPAPVSAAAIVEAQSPTSSPAPVEAPQAPQVNPSDDFSTRFAALSRRERQMQEREAKIKADAEKYNKYIDLETKGKENPLAILESYGIDLDTIISASLGNQPKQLSVEEQIAQLKADMQKEKDEIKAQEEKKKKEEQDAYQSSIEEAILSHQNQIVDYLSKNADKYELIHLHEVQDLVWDTTEAYFEANGEVLSPEKAAEMVENHLYEQTLKATKLSKFKSQVQPPAEQKQVSKSTGIFQESQVNPVAHANSQPQTLSQSLASIAPEKSNTERVSVEESKRRAAEFLKQAWAKQNV